jgi:hypothetical protein
MTTSRKGNSKDLPITSADDVRHFTGPIADHTILEILSLGPTAEDLEVAVIHAQGEGDIAGIEGHTLLGKSAQIYEILSMDEVYQVDDR